MGDLHKGDKGEFTMERVGHMVASMHSDGAVAGL